MFYLSNSGHMIKFQLFDTQRSYQCHFAEISTFVVSIAHYMRAYFNYQALTQGTTFVLPDDAAYLNVRVCVCVCWCGAFSLSYRSLLVRQVCYSTHPSHSLVPYILYIAVHQDATEF
jgi:hypothetical protein